MAVTLELGNDKAHACLWVCANEFAPTLKSNCPLALQIFLVRAAVIDYAGWGEFDNARGQGGYKFAVVADKN